ncbi:hypothetical protein ACIA2T_16240 [Amycolatopsis japonica]|uniref:hypothetical protein n=1 Tax=Amycolatopsis japonica TaxID=208439 RepID=UPI0037A8C8D0
MTAPFRLIENPDIELLRCGPRGVGIGGQNGLAGNALQTYLRWDRILYDEDPVADGTLDEYWVKAG